MNLIAKICSITGGLKQEKLHKVKGTSDCYRAARAYKCLMVVPMLSENSFRELTLIEDDRKNNWFRI